MIRVHPIATLNAAMTKCKILIMTSDPSLPITEKSLMQDLIDVKEWIEALEEE